MINELRALAIFAKVVELGSFRAAANCFQLSPSVVSHHILMLEKRLGVTLLYRSTRRLSLTDEGQQLFISAQAMLLSAESGLNHIAQRTNDPSGKLNITVPALLIRSKLANDIAAFAKEFPRISLSINFSDLQQDIIREGFDLAIRVGDLKDSSLKSKKIFSMNRKLVVSPTLMKNRKSPRQPQDLTGWDWIGLKMRHNTKKLVHQSGKVVTLNFEPKIIVDNIDAVRQFSIAGLGLATPPSFLVERDILDETLIEPLTTWHPDPLSVYAVWPQNATKESLTFKLLTFLQSRKESYY